MSNIKLCYEGYEKLRLLFSVSFGHYRKSTELSIATIRSGDTVHMTKFFFDVFFKRLFVC